MKVLPTVLATPQKKSELGCWGSGGLFWDLCARKIHDGLRSHIILIYQCEILDFGMTRGNVEYWKLQTGTYWPDRIYEKLFGSRGKHLY